MYGARSCEDAAENPANADLCDNNADSYMFFIQAVYEELQREYGNVDDEE